MESICDISYSNHQRDRRLLDIHLPSAEANGAAVLLIHGGGFRGGQKSQWGTVPAYFCRRGYVCASVEYRLSPPWKFPAWIEDVRLAMAFLRRQADRYGYSPDRIAAMGSSAGAYLALMLATIGPDDDLGRTEELTDPHTRPAAVAAYCPATRLDPAVEGFPQDPYPRLMPASGEADPQLYNTARIPDRVDGTEPPILLVHGDDDKLISHAESIGLADRLSQVGGEVELTILPGVEHGFGYGTESDAQRQALACVEAFFAENL